MTHSEVKKLVVAHPEFQEFKGIDFYGDVDRVLCYMLLRKVAKALAGHDTALMLLHVTKHKHVLPVVKYLDTQGLV